MSRNSCFSNQSKHRNVRKKIFMKSNFKISPEEAISKISLSRTRGYEIKTELKECIKERGKNITDFARDMCCNYRLVSAYLNGYQLMTDEFKIKMCAVFKKWDEEMGSCEKENNTLTQKEG
jgi:hypothetical protein